MSRVFIASDLLNKFSQFLMYALCILLMLSIGYDMSYAFLKIIDRGADFLYVTIFTALALIQSFFFPCPVQDVCSVFNDKGLGLKENKHNLHSFTHLQIVSSVPSVCEEK